MSDRVWNPSRTLAIIVVIILSAPTSAPAQTPSTAKNAARGKTAVVSKTPDGQPDLQGYWTNLTFTPFERPAKYGNREFLTAEETAELFKKGVQHSYEFTFENPAGRSEEHTSELQSPQNL